MNTKFAAQNDHFRGLLELRLYDEECTLQTILPHNIIERATDPRALISLVIQKLFNDWEVRRYKLDQEWKDDIIQACFE